MIALRLPIGIGGGKSVILPSLGLLIV